MGTGRIVRDNAADGQAILPGGLVKLVGLKAIEENDWTVTPVRYVCASEEEDEDFDFDDTIR